MSGEEVWPWEERQVGRSKFATSIAPLSAFPVISCPGEPGGMVDIEIEECHLIYTVIQEIVKAWGVFPGAE